MSRIYIIIGSDGVVRGFPYTTHPLAKEARKSADEEYPTAAPHRVVAFVPETAGAAS